MKLINPFFRRQKNPLRTTPINCCNGRQTGFSVMELLLVVIIVLIALAMAIPSVLSALRMGHLRGAASDYAGLLEVARSYSIKDNRYYSTYILSAATGSPVAFAYVDLLPKVLTGQSGNGGTGVTPGDPVVTIESDVVVMAVASAPNTSNLESLLLPSTTPVTPTDTSATAATFGPRGLPCTPNSNMTGGTVCDTSGGPTAYWTFLKNTRSNTWEAVTITPAGRIEKWAYTGSAWQKL
jgi:type II secretory pathway pseudopilin PulG